MQFLHDIAEDIRALSAKYSLSPTMIIMSNRGFHSLLCYRLARVLNNQRIPFLPLAMTRIIQVLYSIDIDYRSMIDGGVIIVHGTGIVIGAGVRIQKGTLIYQQVTLGIKGNRINDGYPEIGENCTLGAGAKLFGAIKIGRGSVIGANAVVTTDIPESSIVKLTGVTVSSLK